jgi:YfiH family protein
MEKQSLRNISPAQSDLLFSTSPLITVPHAMFSRQGGISASPFTGLNLSFSVGDDPAAVSQNREKVKRQLDVQYLASAVQVHGDQVTVVEGLTSDQEYKESDALITGQKGVGLLIQQADCQAVLLHDPQRKVIAAVHNGWKGSVANIIAKTVRAMQENFSTSPEDLRAVISPSLGPCCAEFVHYAKELPLPFHRWQEKENYFDFWAISRWQLREAGVRDENIEAMGICTVCNEDFFSYRRANKTADLRGKPGVTGRNGSVIAMSS